MKNLLAKRKAFGLLEDGLGKVVKRDFEAAVDKFSKAIETQPEMLDAYSYRGNAYVDLGQYQRALADLDYVIQKSPDHHAAYYNRSTAQMGLGRTDLALADLSRAIQLAPEEPGYYLNRSAVHLVREEYDLALEDAAKAIEFGQPKMGHNNRAILFEKKGDLPAAIAEWTKVLEIDPKNARAYGRRGILLAATGDRKSAIEDLQRGMKYKKELPDPLRETVEKTLQELEGTA